jgi:hypothetical protein
VRTDDLLKQYPDLAPWRPKIGLQPRLTDAELATPGGLPAGSALTGANAGERQTRPGILAAGPTLAAARPGQIIIAGRQYDGTGSGTAPAAQRLRLLRPARHGEPERPGARLVKPLRQSIESINQTVNAQLDLDRHGGHTPAGVTVRVLPRILALTTAIWHNDHTSAPVHRSLTACDH